MRKVQKMLGHSRISTTVDIYGQADDVTEATDAVGEGGRVGGPG